MVSLPAGLSVIDFLPPQMSVPLMREQPMHFPE
jgi:hypothetical protein